MSLPASSWKNKNGTSFRTCSCGTWQKHWQNQVKKPWPLQCSVLGCTNKATLGAHIIHSQVMGEKIAPMCESCNKRADNFNLKGGVSLSSAKQD